MQTRSVLVSLLTATVAAQIGPIHPIIDEGAANLDGFETSEIASVSVGRKPGFVNRDGQDMILLSGGNVVGADLLPPPTGVQTVDRPPMWTSTEPPAKSSALQASLSSLASAVASIEAQESRIRAELDPHQNSGSCHALVSRNEWESVCLIVVASISLAVAIYL